MIVDEKYLLDQQKEEIEHLAEDNKRLNELIASGTEVMGYWNNKYLEEQAKNTKLQKRVDDLTEENYKLKVIVDHNCDPFPKWQEETIKEIAELQKQVSKLTKDLDDTKHNRNGWRNRAWEDEKQNAELQKQVDELKEQRDVFKRLFESCNNSSITTEEIINTMNSFYREQAEQLAELKVEQAIKAAVKKFAGLIEFHSVASIEDNAEYFTISALGMKEILWESFGVETYTDE